MPTKSDKAAAVIEGILTRMTMEEKVGQCFTYLWSGYLITPSVVEAIEKLHCGNLRLQPAFLSGKRHKYYDFDTGAGKYDYPATYKPIAETLLSPGGMGEIDPRRYAERLNRLQEIAMSRPCGIPLNMAVDQEGDVSRNYCFGGINLMPSPMGLAASGDPGFVYEAAKAVGRQLSAIGINCIHSPVADVNINPRNPEIGIRSFGDDPKRVSEYALAAMKGLQDGGLITTAKHFPGRGDSMDDAHFGTPVLNVDRRRIDEVELYPYRMLIENGLDCVMIAHNVYTALDPGVIATVSSKIINDLLRGELGFQGVVTTDAIAMRALIKQYPLPEACARALQAGADMVLNKTETAYRDQGFLETLKYVQQGKISEEELNNKVRRILRMKYRRGLFKNGAQVDASRADAPIRDKAVIELSAKAARRAAIVLKDEPKLLPLSPKQKILVIEQRLEDVYLGQNPSLHRLAFTEAMLSHSMNIVAADTELKATPEDEAFVLPLADDADVVVVTNHYLRGDQNNSAFVRKLLDKRAKVVLVTNTPYEMAVVPGVRTAICTFAYTPESMKVAAGIIFGKEKAQGKWPLVNYRV